MNVATRTRLDVIPLSKHIGAEIRGIDLRAPLDPDTIRDIYRTWRFATRTLPSRISCG